MNVVAFNRSARKDGNTTRMVKAVFAELEKEGIDTEPIELAGKPLRGCTACMQCTKNQDKQCVLKDDDLNTYLEKMLAADGIILASPTYFANVSAEMKALIDRAGFVSIANNRMLARKVGAAVIAVRRAGAIHAFNSINHFYLINQMIVPGSTYWNLGIGLQPGDVETDQEGINTMANLGQNIAWLLKKIHT